MVTLEIELHDPQIFNTSLESRIAIVVAKVTQ